MGRRRRIDAPGMWHHVMNRGACHRSVFLTTADGMLFESLVGEWAVRTGTEVHAYCLMRNHFHLLVRSTEGRLAEFMQQVQAGYTRAFNLRRGGDGAIFRGRYHSIHVDTDAYQSVVGRYIHRNPLDVRPAVPLPRYRWCSYRYYVEPGAAPDWLQTGELMAHHDHDITELRRTVEGDDVLPADALTVHHLAHVIADESRADDEAPVPATTVVLALLDHLPTLTAHAIVERLAIASPTALSSARSRARRRHRDDPRVREAVARVLRRVA